MQMLLNKQSDQFEHSMNPKMCKVGWIVLTESNDMAMNLMRSD